MVNSGDIKQLLIKLVVEPVMWGVVAACGFYLLFWIFIVVYSAVAV